MEKVGGLEIAIVIKSRKRNINKSCSSINSHISMSCFKLVKCFLNSINGLISRFWWGNLGGRKGIALVSWNRLCEPKDLSGLGFRSLEEFDRAMLAKQC